ncbi:ATP-binding protein [Bifidobacterium pseudocatenulatum]|uniref:ATP-binding protein n=1 Tax=Bifidobacterium pseudocatenulatum TaxID=28026 RepID=A0A3E5HPS8_BIFPS|nr:ATP-binding protein [Bifidobacterium pseudocatenulatum]
MLEADGHRLGSSARRGVTVMGFVPAPTRLSIPELDWLERARSNAGGTVKVPPHRWTRHDSSAVDSARSELYSMASRQIENTKRARRERQRDEEGVLPLGSASPMDMLTRDFNERPLIPWHQTSTGRAGVLTTFVAGSGAPLIPGPPIGIDALSRELFQFDCWGTYDAGLTTSPDLFFCGLRGQGKSYCAKTIAVREIGFGRRIIVQSDRQGEWKAIADAIPGGQVVSPGKGNYLNPFAMPDSSHLKGDADRRAFRQEVLSGRKSAMMALAEAVKEPDRPFPLDKDMLSLIDQLIASYDVGPMTLEDAVRRLSDWDWVDGVYENIHGFEHYQDLARRKASEAARVFSPMVEGGTMSGMFDRESTITLDPAAPIIVFDTSGPVFQDPTLKRVYTAAVSSWIDRLLQARDGARRIIVCEEAWDLLGNPQLVESLQTRQRSAGHWGCATWLIVHGVADMTQVFTQGSGLRGKVEQLMNLMETKIIYRQGGENITLLNQLVPDLSEDEIAQIPRLAQGYGIWRIGRSHPRMILPVAGPMWANVFDTSGLRRAS